LTSTTAEQQLVLLSAGTSARRQALREQAERLGREVDWRRLALMLRTRKLLPTLGPRLVELTAGTSNADFATEIEQALEAGRRQGAFLQMVSTRATAMLSDAGIRSMALKGPVFAEAIYGAPERRLSNDVDLLVAAQELRAAVVAIRALGYEAPTDYVHADGLPLLHFVLRHGRGELPPVELHWRVHWYERCFAQDRLLAPDVRAAGKWHPAPVDELAALLLFYARDGFIDLRLASDLSAWWDVRGATLQTGAMDELLLSYPELERAIRTSLAVAEKLVGLPTSEILGERPGLSARERVAVRLANPNPRASRSQLYADMGLIDGLLAPPGGFRAFVRRQLLPPREVLAEQALHGARRRPRSPLARCAGMLLRYGLTATRLLRRAEPLPVSCE
jgi:Uncharacterised nucleotidyltransferase